MGDMHGFQIVCKQLTHPFEWVHRTAELVMKYSKWLTWAGELLFLLFEWLYQTAERVVKVFRKANTIGQMAYSPIWKG